MFNPNYSAGFGAATGQTEAQAPQSMQISASITWMLSPSVIASTGHAAIHAPQLTHSSLIKYAIAISCQMLTLKFFLLSPAYNIMLKSRDYLK